MAREANRLGRIIEGLFWIGGFLLAVVTYYYYAATKRRRPRDTRVVCRKCGDALPVTEVLDPGVTCSCVASPDQGDSGIH